MDRERFDALARLLAAKGSRRGALGTILSVAFLGIDPDDGEAKPGKQKGKGRGKRRDKDRSNGKGKGRGKSKGEGKDRRRDRDKNRKVQAQANGCCGNKSCTPPGPGSNKSSCNYAGQDLSGGNYGGSNLSNIDGRGTNFNDSNLRGVNFGKACLQGATFVGADLRSTNFGGACLFDADLTDADLQLNSPNLSKALFCRTILPTGDGGTTVNNRDCGKGSPCCEACNEEFPCPDGQVCCGGRCRAGSCCGTDPSACEVRECQTATCQNNQCRYAPVVNGRGPDCDTRCCSGVCCPTGVTTCDANNRCTVPACNPTTCPNGCCDAQDICRTNSDNTCGIRGVACVDCPGSQVCTEDGVCCTPETPAQTCAGTPPLCGTVINNCGQPVTCECPVRTCRTPRCDTSGNPDVCRYTPVFGDPGPNCADSICCRNANGSPVCCPEGTTSCTAAGLCGPICNETTCPDGCCDSAGVCQTNSDEFCGVGGVACVECNTDACFACLTVGNILGICVSVCTDALPICNPAGVCVAEVECVDDTDCNAAACLVCDEADDVCVSECLAGETCDGNGNCVPVGVCNGTTCPNGCCDAAGVCRTNSDDFCGVGGVTCVACNTDACFACATIGALIGICLSVCTEDLPICNSLGVCVDEVICTDQTDCNSDACLICVGAPLAGICVSACTGIFVCDGRANCL